MGVVLSKALSRRVRLEAQVVVEEAFPVLQRPWSYAVPKLPLDGALDPLPLAVEVGATGLDVGMADAETVEEARQDGGGGAPLQGGSGEEAAAVVHQGELVAFLREVLEVHLGSLSRDGFPVADPDGFRLARSAHKSATAAENAMDAAQAATDDSGLSEVGMQTTDADVQLAVSMADNVQDAPLESGRAMPGPSRAITQGAVAFPSPSGPLAGEVG